jgi:hypothetical protein
VPELIAPQAVAGELSARLARFLAAFGSRSWTVPQAGQVQMRSFKVSPSWICPHALHVFDDGKNRGATVTLQAYRSALYLT